MDDNEEFDLACEYKQFAWSIPLQQYVRVSERHAAEMRAEAARRLKDSGCKALWRWN